MSDLLRQASTAAAFWPSRLPARLQSVEEKLRRADEHRQLLAAEIAAFVATPPYRITESSDGDVHTLVAEVQLVPPVRFAVVLGDLLYNLRSALDHMAWQFALVGSPAPDWRTAFPIYDDAKAFRSGARIRDVPPDAARLIEAMQPYQEEYEVLSWLGRELVPLRNMSNRDKHQTLHIVTALVEPKYVETSMSDHSMPVEFTGSGDRQRATIRMPVGSRGHFDAMVTILDDDLPWRSGLDGIATHVVNATRNAIAAFKPLFRLLR